MKVLSKLVPFVLLLALTFSSLGVTPAYAATLTVANTADSGAGSLRQTIASAVSGDTITFDNSLSGQTITLTSGELVIDKNLVIEGLGVSQLTVSGNNASRVFYINSGVTLTISDLTIAYGYAPGGSNGANGADGVDNNGETGGNGGVGANGGGIYNLGTLTLMSTDLNNNHAGAGGQGGDGGAGDTYYDGGDGGWGGNGGNGGAIFNAAGATLLIEKSFVHLNKSGDGGAGGVGGNSGSDGFMGGGGGYGRISGNGAGIYSQGNLTITQTTFDANTAGVGGGGGAGGTGGILNGDPGVDGWTGPGGGIFSAGTLTVSNSTFSNNNSRHGGGIYNLNPGIATISNSTFSGNKANDANGLGGGISNTGTVTISNSTFYNNYSLENGGAIFNLGFNTPGVLNITNSTFSENSTGVTIFGASVSNSSGTVHLKNSIFANAQSGVECYGGLATNTNNLIEDNTCSPSLSGDPKLDALADNGGPTQTMALLSGSPAIGAGDDANCPATDQRGVARPQGSHCDIGAYEFEVIDPIFADVSESHPYFTDIEILYANGYTAGCSTSPLLFCPDVSMSRAQNAVFMLRGNFGSGYVPVTPTHFFKDNWKNSSWAEGWAESMYIEGLTGGCSQSPLKFCPDEIVTNVELAVFGLRLKYGMAYAPPAAQGIVFADMTDTGFWGTGWAEQAYTDGLIPSCGTDVGSGLPKFCPNALVTRGFGASVIVKAKNLTMP